MEINITELFNSICPSDFSASQAEIGTNAGIDTWNASKDQAKEMQLISTEEQKEAFISHILDFGCWEDEEIKNWSDIELNALFIQLVSGDMRAFLDCFGLDSESWNWDEYNNDENTSGSLYQGDDNEVYYYLGC